MRAWAAAGLLLALLIAAPASAAPADSFETYNAALIGAVTGTAYAFMAPRTLQAVTIPQMALWGLGGLTTLDLRFTVELRDGSVRLLRDEQPVLAVAPPPALDASAWGTLTADVSRAAWNASEQVREAGNRRLVRSFFDDLLSHFDPYTRYLPADVAEEDIRRRVGSAGIGARLERRGRGYVIGTLSPDGPAADAGLREGDAVLAIDGQTIGSTREGDVAALLSGPEGSSVVLQIRGRDRHVREVTLQRAFVPDRTVFMTRQGKILTLRIDAFADDTADELRVELLEALSDLRDVRGIVIDLRGNRGGVLRQAVEAAELLVEHGTLVRTMGRNPAADHDFAADGEDLARGLPVVVLVDGESASSAEVLAAALADRGRAVVVGSSTLGKGLVQTVTTLPDGGELFVTWSRVLAPGGWPIQSLGVLPQVCTSLGRAELKDELAALKDGREPFAEALERRRAVRPDTPEAEILAIRDACPAAEGSDADTLAARSLLEDSAAYAAALLDPAPE